MPAKITLLRFRFWDNAGDKLSGGKVYFYETGTSTPKDTYSDAAGVTPNANPVILDADGFADIHLDGVYKVVITDSDDVTLHTIDPVKELSDLQAPASTTDNALVRWDGTDGGAVQDSGTTLTDAGILTLVNNLRMPNNVAIQGEIAAGGSYNSLLLLDTNNDTILRAGAGNKVKLEDSSGNSRFVIDDTAGTITFTGTGVINSLQLLDTGEVIFKDASDVQTLKIHTDGGVTIGAAPTGGSQGAGTLNVDTNLYVDGVAVTTGGGSAGLAPGSEVIESQTVSGGESYITFTDFVDDTLYTHYSFIFEDCYLGTAGNDILMCAVGTGATPTWEEGTAEYSSYYPTLGTASLNRVPLADGGGTSSAPYRGELTLWASASLPPSFSMRLHGASLWSLQNGADDGSPGLHNAIANSAMTMTSIRFMWDNSVNYGTLGGTWGGGKIHLIGHRRAAT